MNCEFPDANELISSSFALPFYPWLESYEIEQISDAMVKACSY